MPDLQEICDSLQQAKGNNIHSYVKSLITVLEHNYDQTKATIWYTIIDCICETYVQKQPHNSKNQTLFTESKDLDKHKPNNSHKQYVFFLFYLLCLQQYMPTYIMRALFDNLKSPFESIDLLELLYLLTTHSIPFRESMQSDNKIRIIYELLQRCVNEGLKYEQKKGISAQYEDKIKIIQPAKTGAVDKAKEPKKVD